MEAEFQAVQVGEYPDGSEALMLGNSEDNGIVVTTTINTPKYGAGVVGHAQIGRSIISVQIATNQGLLNYKRERGPELDHSHPIQWKKSIPAETRVPANRIDISYGFEDSPGVLLGVFPAICTKVVAEFTMQLYAIYKPDGDSIWVTLGKMDWGWKHEANRDPITGKWKLGEENIKVPTATYFPSSELPEWNSVYKRPDRDLEEEG